MWFPDRLRPNKTKPLVVTKCTVHAGLQCLVITGKTLLPIGITYSQRKNEGTSLRAGNRDQVEIFEGQVLTENETTVFHAQLNGF